MGSLEFKDSLQTALSPAVILVFGIPRSMFEMEAVSNEKKRPPNCSENFMVAYACRDKQLIHPKLQNVASTACPSERVWHDCLAGSNGATRPVMHLVICDLADPKTPCRWRQD